MEIRVGDRVVPKGNPQAVAAKVAAIDDLGHGVGYERVTVHLLAGPLTLTSYFAAYELEVSRKADGS